MTIFPPHDIDSMNEDDVAGDIVRPLCRALGYAQGNADANLRSQVSVQYNHAFLGHKNPSRDPILRGRADFICEVVSYSRWVVEAKKPSISLGLEDSYQAHTYATHPEIAAEFYLLTNGREFRLYRIANPETPALVWQKEETDIMLPALKNFLGPDAMKKRATVAVDLGKPLANGLGSSVKVVGGHVVYERNKITVPVNTNLNGLVNTVVGDRIFRTETGLISGELMLKSSSTELDALFEGSGIYPLRFSSSDEYLSTDANRPTLMQNLFTFDMPKGTRLPRTPMSPGGIVPVHIRSSTFIEVCGYVEQDEFKGSFKLRCEYKVGPSHALYFPRDIYLQTSGSFVIRISSWNTLNK